ncbi:MAG TPA: transglutaminase domain-containing protein, partial [Anaeromyxobacteraceae bacterium]|nr:transglutaminase domain-containing protein [Anaeromyxobacteraceae bacterium]
MIAAALALLAAAALPEGTARWRMELAGEPAGVVELSIRCDGPACLAAWTSRQRLPEEAGGAVRARRVEVPVDAEGRAQGPARLDEEGRRREVALPRGATPAMLVEVALAARRRAGEPSPCLDAVEESTGEPFRACARAGTGGAFAVEGRDRELVTPGAGPFPARVALAAQGVAFVLDARAELPRAPRLYGVVVAGPDDPRDAASFCGVARDPEPPADGAAGLPRAEAPGRAC